MRLSHIQTFRPNTSTRHYSYAALCPPSELGLSPCRERPCAVSTDQVSETFFRNRDVYTQKVSLQYLHVNKPSLGCLKTYEYEYALSSLKPPRSLCRSADRRMVSRHCVYATFSLRQSGTYHMYSETRTYGESFSAPWMFTNERFWYQPLQPTYTHSLARGGEYEQPKALLPRTPAHIPRR